MPQDAYTMNLAANELSMLICPGKVNKIYQPSRDEIDLIIFNGKASVNLSICANAQSARVCPTFVQKENPAVAPNFCMLLRKHLQGAQICSVQTVKGERVLIISFSASDELSGAFKRKLACELMGKYSNVFLLGDKDELIGSLRPAYGDISAVRALLPGMPYTLPPAQDKFDIDDASCVINAIAAFSGAPAAALASSIKGISKMLAEEICSRFFKGENQCAAGREKELYEFAKGLLENPPFKPNAVKMGDRYEFFPFDFETVAGEKKFFPSLLEAEAYCFDSADTSRALRERQRKIREKLKSHEKKLTKKLSLLLERELDCADAETNKLKGELLTAYSYAVPPLAEKVELVNYYDEAGGKICVSLDKDLSALGNAQQYYKKYQKQKKTLAAVIPQKQEASAELDYIADLYSQLELCDTKEDFDALSEELINAGYIDTKAPKKKKAEQKSMPKTFVLGGFYVRVGRNNLQNDALTFSARRDDIWLHTKDYHSAHVIIETEGRPVPDEVLLAAAEICAYHSKAREGNKVPVDYCFKKYVKKPPKAKPGGVIYTDFKTIFVSPRPHDELKK